MNGTPILNGKQDYQFLFTYPDVVFQPGTLEAVGYNQGKEVTRYKLETAGKPVALKLTTIENPKGWKADGADLLLAQVEAVDTQGRRCPLANNMIYFSVEGPAEWRGGIAQGTDNYILSKDLPIECGINRVLIRSTTTAGTVTLKAKAEGLKEAEITFKSLPFETKGGLTTFIPGDELQGNLNRGETPQTPSYQDTKIDVPILSAVAGANVDKVMNSFDDNELSEWKNDGKLSTAWITYQLQRMAQIDEICIKLTGWRQRSYPLEIYAGDELIWSGETERSLGYVHLQVKPIMAREITVRLKGSNVDKDAFGAIVELVEPVAGELDLFKAENGEQVNFELRIIEIELKETLFSTKET